MKTCTKCRMEKASSEFGRDQKAPDGLNFRCRACNAAKTAEWRQANPEKVRAATKARYANNPEKQRADAARWKANRPERTRDMNRRANLKANYRLSVETFDEMLTAQDGCCAICGGNNSGKVLHVDHDHATGRVRGLLCGPCNIGLGGFRDDPQRMLRAIRYLFPHTQVPELLAEETV